MQEFKKFQLNYLRQEQHIMLPNTTSIVLTQNLYDILFQYVINPEKEEKLKLFIDKLETHIKSKPKAPFSMPITDLDFLGDGIEELRLLNWLQSQVFVFEVKILEDCENEQEEMGKILELLTDMFTFNRQADSNLIYVYSNRLTPY
jgi:hypothetical protein